MNQRHIEALSSQFWADLLRRDMLPWVTSNVDLGDDVLEIGPGPGLTTDLVRELTPRLTAVEVDTSLAEQLAARLEGTNVEVINADILDTDFPDERFSAVVCFAVLHHVANASVQQNIFREIFRVLRPGGSLAGSDGYDNDGTRQGHEGDLFVPIDPDQLPDRLATVGFTNVVIDRGDYDYRFSAAKPSI
jgi:SAM-dependent methyltransferase